MATDVQKVAAVLPHGGPCLPIEAVAERAGMSANRAADALGRLSKMALAAEAAPACYVASTKASLTSRSPITAEEARTPVARAWSIIRADRKADFGQLLAVSGLRIWDLAGLRPWFEGLVAAGVLMPIQRAAIDEPAWVLMRTEMGPRPPVVIYSQGGNPRHVFDPNTGDALPVERSKKRVARGGRR